MGTSGSRERSRGDGAKARGGVGWGHRAGTAWHEQKGNRSNKESPHFPAKRLGERCVQLTDVALRHDPPPCRLRRSGHVRHRHGARGQRRSLDVALATRHGE